MFNSLTGTITQKLPQKIFLENNGIEWDISMPDSSLDKLGAPGEKARVFTYLQHTDSLMNLFGFATEDERNLFFDLLKVDGIGPKAALKIMSNIDSSSFVTILDNGDLGALEKVPGVGKKTAQKMLLQLKGKLTLSENTAASSSKKNVPFEAVVTALVSMGHDRKNAEAAIIKIADELSRDESFAGLSDSAKEDAVFRKAIVELAQ